MPSRSISLSPEGDLFLSLLKVTTVYCVLCCHNCDHVWAYYNHPNVFFSIAQLVPTSVPGDRENECTCSGESSSSAVIAVSAVSLLLIVTLTTVILTQCLLIIRMRRRSRNKTETYAEVTNPTTNTTDVPVSPNEAYGLTKITRPREEVTYELVK